MFKFLLKGAVNISQGIQENEIKEYIKMLEKMENEELYLTTVMITHIRNSLVFHDLLNPIAYSRKNLQCVFEVQKLCVSYTNAGNPYAAIASKAWVHTIRAGLKPELRPLVKILWEEISRGIIAIKNDESGLYNQFNHLESREYYRIPVGFEPDNYNKSYEEELVPPGEDELPF